MVGLPFQRLRCLGSLTEVTRSCRTRDPVIARRVQARDHRSLANGSHPAAALHAGEKDGGRASTHALHRTVRIPADDPNCVERGSLYLRVAELSIQPTPARDARSPIGLHTFRSRWTPIIVDPASRNCLDCGLALAKEAPVPVEAHDAIAWTAQLAEAGAAHLRHGPSRVRRARNAVMELVEEGVAPADEATVDAIAWMLATAERVARKYGTRAVAVVRSTAQAIADLADEALARAQRNLSIEIGGRRFKPAPWASALARSAGRVGMDLGAAALRTKLASLGVTGDLVGLVESELNREGMSLGALGKPTAYPTLASHVTTRAA